MKKLFFLLLFPLSVHSQQAEYDYENAGFYPLEYLEHQLKLAKTPDQEVNTLIAIYLNYVNYFSESDRKEFNYYSMRLETTASYYNSPLLVAKANHFLTRGGNRGLNGMEANYDYAAKYGLTEYRVIALIDEARYYRRADGNFARAIDTLNVALDFSKGSDSSRIEVLLELTSNYLARQDNIQAIKCAYAALDLSYNIKSLYYQARSAILIGGFYWGLHIFDKARDFIMQAINWDLKLQKPYRLINDMAQLVALYLNNKEWDNAISSLQQLSYVMEYLPVGKKGQRTIAGTLLNSAPDSIPDRVLKNLIFVARKYLLLIPSMFLVDNAMLAEAYEKNGNLDSAKKYLTVAQSLINDSNNRYMLTSYYFSAGAIGVSEGNENGAIDAYLKGLQVSQTQNHTGPINSFAMRLEAIYLKRGDYFNVYKCRKIYDSIQSVSTQQSYKAFLALQEAANLENQRERSRLEKERALQQKKQVIYLILALLAVGGIVTAIRWRIDKARKQRADHEKQLLELEAKALRAQMNPHFIFNCLNSIKSLIQQHDSEKSVSYLTTFSKLIRNLFNNADKKEISLYDEIETCKLYLQLESMRFDTRFSYDVTVDENIDLKSIQVPALIIQPFIENAIWHGIIPRNSGGTVSLKVVQRDRFVDVIIDDDGIGRDASQQNRSISNIVHQSKGVNLTQSRLELNNLLQQRQAKLEVVDKKDEDGQSKGTTVIISIKEENA